jgi:PHO85 cyclin-5
MYLQRDEIPPLAGYNTLQKAQPYSSSTLSSWLIPSAFSDTSSQSSDDSSGSDSCDSYPASSQTSHGSWNDQESLSSFTDHVSKTKSQQHLRIEVIPPELRQNPRRSSTGSSTRSGCPPPLVRQADRKVNFVDNLVGKP